MARADLHALCDNGTISPNANYQLLLLCFGVASKISSKMNRRPDQTAFVGSSGRAVAVKDYTLINSTVPQLHQPVHVWSLTFVTSFLASTAWFNSSAFPVKDVFSDVAWTELVSWPGFLLAEINWFVAEIWNSLINLATLWVVYTTLSALEQQIRPFSWNIDCSYQARTMS